MATTASHLQPVTSLVVDPSSNFILSGSDDANIHVWSLYGILSFSKPGSGRDRQPPNAPIATFSNHRAAITSLAIGHSRGQHNIAVSTAKDNTAIVWDYRTGRLLRTYLLPSSATCVALDPVDRAGYVGYEDGSVQSIDFYRKNSAQNSLYDSSLQSTPVQVSADVRWHPPAADSGSVKALGLSYDGTTLLSAHESGKVLSWNVARRKFATSIADFTHPVTNLVVLRPSGLPSSSQELHRTIRTIVKPRHNSFADPAHAPGAVPSEYMFHTHLVAPSQPRPRQPSQFTQALNHPSFPGPMIEDGLAELAALRQGGGSSIVHVVSATSALADAPADAAARDNHVTELEAEVTTLNKKVAVNDQARHASAEEVAKLRAQLARQRAYLDELNEKRDAALRDKVLRQARKEEREAKRREAWFAAEKKGRNGDAVMKKMELDEGILTSESDEPNDE